MFMASYIVTYKQYQNRSPNSCSINICQPSTNKHEGMEKNPPKIQKGKGLYIKLTKIKNKHKVYT